MSANRVPFKGVSSPFYCATYLETCTRVPITMAMWALAGGVATVLSLLDFLMRRDYQRAALFAILSACIGLLPLTMKGIYSVLLSWAQLLPTFCRPASASAPDVQLWVRMEFERLGKSPAPKPFGILYSSVVVALLWRAGAFRDLSTTSSL